MRVVYGKGAERIELTDSIVDLSWSSSRGQIAQTCDIRIRNSPLLQAAGFLMLFSGEELMESEQFFHGPIVNPRRDDKTVDLSATAYELSWYLQKNDTGPVRLNGDAGKELERVIKGTGIAFSCPSLGFSIKERMVSQSYGSLYTTIMEQAYEKTGKRYFLQHQRDKLTVVPEGGNQSIPLFRADLLESSSTGNSIEDVYTVVTVERYKDDKVAGRVTKENGSLIQDIGRMEKMVDAGEDTNLSSLADRQLKELSKVPVTRSITVKHSDPKAAMLRAGWAIKIQEKDGQTISDWIVTSCRGMWKGGQFTMDLEMERR
ncbi:hypothetical protein LOK74_19075 [Brevibacillus humidisoli]|uniref:XkdQ/YqbQ family protein n=1 Tax=Brevibacillus humidisoli TaxID=2895522 RepID=UPI001E3FE04C|nr:hypothetical protein [Brevibacillus humidisoli]UFJ40117.1 hypothetical protein LOK74_19075 [Brevibacillus humidisoli]